MWRRTLKARSYPPHQLSEAQLVAQLRPTVCMKISLTLSLRQRLCTIVPCLTLTTPPAFCRTPYVDVCDDADYSQMLKNTYSEDAKAAGVPAITSAGEAGPATNHTILFWLSQLPQNALHLHLWPSRLLQARMGVALMKLHSCHADCAC